MVIYNLADTYFVGILNDPIQSAAVTQAAPVLQAARPVAEGATARGGTPFPLWTALWLAGALLCAAYYAAAYIRCRRRFRESLPVGCPYVQAWQGHCRLRRRVSIRQSGQILSG